MKPIYRTIFLLFGIAAIIVMLATFDVDFAALRSKLPRAVAFLPAVVGVWVVVYALNAWAFQVIINSSGADKRIDLAHSLKLTISGYAFTYTTPFGFGGGPYRVMELAGHIGMNRALSSVVLYSMMHILSHFCLWATGLALFIVYYTEKMNSTLWAMTGIFAVVLFAACYVFRKGYKNGLVEKLYRLVMHFPLFRGATRRFYDRHVDAMAQIDRNIAYLHEQPRAFWTSLGAEYVARLVNVMEFYFILLAFGAPITYVDAVLVLALSSLIGNLLFFMPMQMGAREGGLALIIKILGYANAGGVGIFTAFFTRIRELVWIFIGVSLVKVGNKQLLKPASEPPVAPKNEPAVSKNELVASKNELVASKFSAPSAKFSEESN